jgi:DNA (cytosine-5)-methyltransferase 1
MIKIGALCAGYGGLELALQHIGTQTELAWFSDTDNHANHVMSTRFKTSVGLGDLTKISNPPSVDVVTAGFPCQPVSQAGKRLGMEDERWLIDDVCRIGREAGAKFLLLENVSGICTANGGHAFSRVVSALAENGFSAEWTHLPAAEVGAPHNRLRWFCLAYTDSGGHGCPQNCGTVGRLDIRNESETRERERSRTQFGNRSDASHADPNSASKQTWGDTGCGGECFWQELMGYSPSFADSYLSGRVQHGRSCADETKHPAFKRCSDGHDRFGQYGPAIARWEFVVGRCAPDAVDASGRLNASFVEWMMGLPEGWVTDIVDSRTAQLKLLGNGVVPQQAAHAFRILAQQATSEN